MPDVTFDRFYRYDELTSVLQGWATEHPTLFAVSSIGQSFEGRDIWLATVTNTDTGPHEEKPAFWVEANIHASEVTGCTAALHLLHKLVTSYDIDPKVTRNAIGWRADDSTTDRVKVEWVVEAPDGGTLGIEARHQRAGVVRADVQL